MATAKTTQTYATTTAVESSPEPPSGGLSALGINGGYLLAQGFNFLLVLLVVWKWIYKPVLAKLDERSGMIQSGVQNAELAKKSLEQAKEHSDSMIIGAKKEAAELMRQTRDQLEVERERVLQETKEQVRQVVESGKKEIARERVSMVQSARKELAAVVVEAAGVVLSDSMTAKKSESLAKDVIEKMKLV
ncbi:F0F1 ATP synthase subunit B [Candidatus Uhrbacteria bacterium]|nr:F0F1 ATP synthase subunit B [Candidatus Uhrbacteria bacterium]